MTHFTVMVKIPECNSVDEALVKMKDMLEPYNENMECEEYKERMEVPDIYRMIKTYLNKNLPDHNPEKKDLEFEATIVGSLRFDEVRILLSQMNDWCGHEGGIDSEGFYRFSTYNPKSKWDWYSVGGRWKGMLVPNNRDYMGYKGNSGVFNNESMHPSGVDLARADMIDFDKSGWKDDDGTQRFSTHAVLDEYGWHEASKMGWFAITYDETEDDDTWRAKFKERFLINIPKDTYIAVVDCHI